MQSCCHYTGKCKVAAISIGKLKHTMPKEIPVAFHNGLSYDDSFIIKELAKEFEAEFSCLGENSEKHKIFLAWITKEVQRIDKNWEEIRKFLQFIDSVRFMASSLSNFVYNIADKIYKIKCKYRHDNKK